MDFALLAFYAFAAVTVMSAVAVISVRNPVHAALFLVLTFFTVACTWLIAGAERMLAEEEPTNGGPAKYFGYKAATIRAWIKEMDEGIPREGLGLAERVRAWFTERRLRQVVADDEGMAAFTSFLPDTFDVEEAAKQGRSLDIPGAATIASFAWREIIHTADAHDEPGDAGEYDRERR